MRASLHALWTDGTHTPAATAGTDHRPTLPAGPTDKLGLLLLVTLEKGTVRPLLIGPLIRPMDGDVLQGSKAVILSHFHMGREQIYCTEEGLGVGLCHSRTNVINHLPAGDDSLHAPGQIKPTERSVRGKISTRRILIDNRKRRDAATPNRLGKCLYSIETV